MELPDGSVIIDLRHIYNGRSADGFIIIESQTADHSSMKQLRIFCMICVLSNGDGESLREFISR